MGFWAGWQKSKEIFNLSLRMRRCRASMAIWRGKWKTFALGSFFHDGLRWPTGMSALNASWIFLRNCWIERLSILRFVDRLALEVYIAHIIITLHLHAFTFQASEPRVDSRAALASFSHRLRHGWASADPVGYQPRVSPARFGGADRMDGRGGMWMAPFFDRAARAVEMGIGLRSWLWNVLRFGLGFGDDGRDQPLGASAWVGRAF